MLEKFFEENHIRKGQWVFINRINILEEDWKQSILPHLEKLGYSPKKIDIEKQKYIGKEKKHFLKWYHAQKGLRQLKRILKAQYDEPFLRKCTQPYQK